MTIKARLYVVEMLIKGHYVPTVGVGVDREQGRKKLRYWKETNPSDKFRLNVYVRNK